MASVTAAPHAPGDREVLPDALGNLRDLGGLCTADGRAIRVRRLLRGAAPSHAGPAALAELAALLGPCDLIDLRTDAEVARDGGADALVERGWAWIRHPIADGNTASGNAAGTGTAASAAVADEIRTLRAVGAYTAAALFVADRLISASTTRPCVVCCSLGKDRTGAVIAILLSWIGVSRLAIEQDFEFSDDCLARQRGLLPERWRPAEAIGPADRTMLRHLLSAPGLPPGAGVGAAVLPVTLPSHDLRTALAAALCDERPRDERSDDVGLRLEPGATGTAGVG